ncbi:rhodanese-like domain-containing protein [Xanthomarina sp. F1114]|uniref:rhodanese-like domain-containing protein n=1 Tax=Xanthomarina sp. F1114 TaxID=2996019 RepID=UPI00225E49D8|nr:rhodanese-like domain-containing protein [Xanthomarina sp. F1114]MCX7546900.1 rhodanese-like domain-containing protein [Xanthomarina sp. F1114]
MKPQIVFILTLFSVIQIGFSQESLSELLKKHNTHQIPYISVEELAMPKTKAIILDAREYEEYQVSHLKNAVFVGFNDFNLENTSKQIKNKQQTIVVYCSLGIRSENIAEKLSKAGYTNIYNLYGGVFEWKNKGFDVYDTNETKTEKVHAFSPEWSKWLTSGKKVFK